MTNVQKITPNLWFNSNAEEAVNYYLSIFKNSRIGKISYYNREGFEIHHKPAGTVLTIQFWLEGQEFIALNGGPEFKFSEACSFIVNCETQEEIDYYWERLGRGGDESAQVCGWLKDKYGLSWQIAPTIVNDMFLDAQSDKAQRAMGAMLKMKKLDIAALKKAYDG